MSSTAARSTIQAVHALAQSPRNSPQPYEAPAAPCVRLQTMERLLAQFRGVAGETSMLSFTEFKQAADIKTDSFAKRLFKAIDADGNGCITCEEYVNFLYNLECRDIRGRLKVLFDLYDIDESGSLGNYELQSILKESVYESNATMDQGLISFLAECLLDAFDKDNSGDISFEEFVLAMSQFPDVFSGLTIHGSGLTIRSKCSMQKGFWAWAKCYCRGYYGMIVNNRERAFSAIVLFIMLALAFWWRLSLYVSGPKYDLMGWTLPVAKGFGQMMKVCFTLILFPISRNFMTWLRKTPLKYVFPVDDAIDYHKILGTLVFIFAWVHSLCHVNDIWRWGDPLRVEQWKIAFPEEEAQPTRMQITTSLVGVTGILQLLIYTIVFFTASNWPRRSGWMKNTRIGRAMNDFNFIWFAHHLVFVGMALLIFHPMPHIPDEANEWGYSDSWVWIGIPLVVYLIERLIRWYRRSKSVQVLSAEILPGRVIAVKLSKPKNMICKTGMFIYINAPMIAKYEWHPFSLTSPPDASHLCVHIKVCGDWTEALFNHLSQCAGVPSRCHDGKELVTRLSAAGMGRRESFSRPNNVQTATSLVWQPAASPRHQTHVEASPASQTLYKGMINQNFVALPESITGRPKSPQPSNNRPDQESGGDQSLAITVRTPRDDASSDAVSPGEASRRPTNTRRCDSFAVDLSHLPVSPRPMLGVESPFSLKIDGPYGAPVQGFKEHSVLLLVGAGIGVTPFAGILSDLVYRIRQSGSTTMRDNKGLIPGLPKLKKVYFYWSVRSQSEVVWFSRVLEAISKDDTYGILDINVHVTGLKDTKDVRTALLKIVQVSMHVSTGVDVMSGLRSRVLTHFGRPDWDSVFQRIQDKYPKDTVGVFYSGPNTLASILHKLSQKHSNKGGRFKFVKEAFGYW